MRVRAKLQRETAAALVRFARLQRGHYPGAADHLPTFFDSILRILEKAEGHPPGSFEEFGWNPPKRWWEVIPGWWVHYTMEVKKPWWPLRLFQKSLLKITVLDLNDEGPT